MENHRQLKCVHCGVTTASNLVEIEKDKMVCPNCGDINDIKVSEDLARKDIW